MTAVIDAFFTHLTQINIGCVLAGFLVLWVRRARVKLKSNTTYSLEALLGGALALAAVPTSAALVITAFDTSYIAKLNDFPMYITVAALVLLFMGVTTFIKQW